MTNTTDCSHDEYTVFIEEDDLSGVFAAIKRCSDCGNVSERRLLGETYDRTKSPEDLLYGEIEN